jgi:glycosyltransferase involved in cell wall biosynthesis
MPAYNGEATIGASIEALLAQTFGEFELIVSDNASTDSTADIVQALAAKDARIRYVRQPENLGVNGNYSFVARAARGEYLKWASASDWCAPTFLERCLALLEREPSAVLAASRTRLFEGDISNARDYPDDVEILDDSPLDRFVHLIRAMRLNNAMNGLIRLTALRRTRLIESYQSADLVLMGRLALLGKFLLVKEPLFYRRMEAATSTALQDADAVRRYHHPRMGARASFQRWKQHAGWFRAVASAPMPPRERARALALVARRIYWDKRALADDLREAWRSASFFSD